MGSSWIACGMALAVALSFAWPDPGADSGGGGTRLGSPDFAPTPERPFGWRGDGTGRFVGATPPTEWSPTQNVRWSAIVGKSYSSPILAGGRVIVTSEPNLLVCLDRSNGRELWRTEVRSSDLADPKARAAADDYHPKETGLAAATPVTDGKNVYTVFANGIVCAFGLDGARRWSAFIHAPQSTSYGRCASPLLVGGKLIVHMTNLYAFAPDTGMQIWVNRECKCAYGTPVCVKPGSVDLIVTPAGDVVHSETGRGVNHAIGNSFNSSPVAFDDVVFYCEKEARAVRLTAEFKDQDVWNGEIQGDGKVEVIGSPLLHDGLLFSVNHRGDLFAFEVGPNGASEPVIHARPVFEDGDSYASVTLAGSYLFLCTNQGETALLEATRKAKRVARNRLKEGSGASPVFSGNDIFLRDGEKLFCIGR